MWCVALFKIIRLKKFMSLKNVFTQFYNMSVNIACDNIENST